MKFSPAPSGSDGESPRLPMGLYRWQEVNSFTRVPVTVRRCEGGRSPSASRLAASHRRSWRARSVMTSKDGPRCSRGTYRAGCRISRFERCGNSSPLPTKAVERVGDQPLLCDHQYDVSLRASEPSIRRCFTANLSQVTHYRGRCGRINNIYTDADQYLTTERL